MTKLISTIKASLPNSLSMRFGLMGAFTFIIVTISTLFTFLTLNHFKNLERESILKQIKMIGKMGANSLPAHHYLIQKEEDIKSKFFQEIKEELLKLKDYSPLIKNVYTIKRIDNHCFEFLVDAETDTFLFSKPGSRFYAKDLEAAYLTKDTFYSSNEFENDKWGTWLSGFTKLYDQKGEVIGLLGIDYSAEDILRIEQSITYQIFKLVALLFIFSLALAIILTHFISKPLANIAKDMIQVKSFNLENSLATTSWFTEIKQIQEAEKDMKNGLKSFRKYLPHELVRDLIIQKKEANLGGEKRELCIFFSDIEDFSKLAEKLDSDELSKLLEKYFEVITEIILKKKGTVDKYIGDAVMAFWGAPHSFENINQFAVDATIEILSELEHLNRELEKKGHSRINTRIGLHSGEVWVGNFGYIERMNYTVLGDPVNIASRLEGLNKYFNTSLIISENVLTQIHDKPIYRTLGNAIVKGRTTPIKIYEIINPRLNNNIQELNENIANYEHAIQLIEQEAYKQALVILNNLGFETQLKGPVTFWEDELAQRLKGQSSQKGINISFNNK